MRRPLVAIALAILLAAGGAVAVWASGALTPSHPVPGLIGTTQAKAEQLLQPLHLHLVVSGRSYDPHAAAGTVISQRPSGGDLRQGSGVAVTLSLGPRPVNIPGVVGLNSATASALLTYVGLRSRVVGHVASMTAPAGVVVSSSPGHGSLLPGQQVALVVSTGKPMVAIPALGGASGASFAAARRTLSAAGLAATEKTAYSDTVPAGAVLQTTPAAGQKVIAGSPVTVVISEGPHLVPVPNVNGDSVGAASETLSGAGFQVSGVTGNPIATVTATWPPSGEVIRFGSAVQIITG
jgi:serine/threonine-protein kinase